MAGKAMTFAGFLRSYRDLVQKGNETKLARMLLLTDIKPLSAVWRMGPYNSWETLLTKEHLCSVAYFRAFELATTMFKRATIERIGADAAVVVARVEPALRDPVLKKVEAHIEMFRVPPSRQIIWSYVRTLRYLPPTTFGRAPRHVRH